MRWLKFIGIALLLVALLLAGGVVYLTTTDLSRFKNAVEQAVFEATGRTLTISGRFEPAIGLTSSLIATDVDFANADWSKEPVMAHVDHFAVSINLLSLIRQPVVVSNLELRGARIRFEVDDKGRENWELGMSREVDEGSEMTQLVPVVFPKVDLRDIEITHLNQPDARKLILVIDQITEHAAGTGLLNVDFRGRLNERPIEITGYIGPIDNLLVDNDIRQKFSGRIGDLELDVEGQIGKFATMQDPDLRFELRADELSHVSEMLDLGSMGTGSLHALGRLSPIPDGVSVELDAQLGAIHASVSGSADALLDNKTLELLFDASGPDLALLNPLIKGLPEGSFELSGRLEKRRSAYSFDKVRARVGENTARVQGTLGELPQLKGTSIEFHAAGPDFSAFSGLAGFPLQANPFVAEGRVDWESGVLKLTDINASIGDNRMALDGVLGPPPELYGTRLKIRAKGPDLSAIPLAATFADAPEDAFDVQAQLGVEGKRYTIRALHAKVGEFELRANGVVGVPPRVKGTDLRIEAGGPDLSRLTKYAGVDGLPAAPYTVNARLRSRGSRYLVEGLVAEIGSARLELDGEIGTSTDLAGTAIEFRSSIPDLALFEPAVDQVRLPNEPFEGRGHIRIGKSGYELEKVTARLGNVSARVEGIVARSSDLTGTSLKFEASAPDLGLLAPYVKDLAVAKQPFSAAGHVRLLEQGYEFRETTATLGSATLRIDGTVGKLSNLTGSNVSFLAAGPNFAEVASIANLDAPSDPFRIEGRAERFEEGLRIHQASAEVGEYKLELTGVLGKPPSLAGTDLNLTARGPNLRLVSQLAGLDRSLPDDSFEISGRFNGTPDEFRFEEFVARLGESDLAGSLDLNLRDKPDLKGELHSKFFDLDQILKDEAGGTTDKVAIAKPTTAEEKTGAKQAATPKAPYLISDTPIDLSGFDAVNLDVRIVAEKARFKGSPLSDVEIGLQLRDGRLVLDPISGRDEVRGAVSATMALEPEGDGYNVVIKGQAERLRLGLLAYNNDDPANIPPLDVKFEFEGRGSSLHQLAASGNGSIEVVQGSGRISNSVVELFAADLFQEIIYALNPFRESDPFTKYKCGVLGGKIVDGVATVNPIAVRTEKMTIVGSGQIDFKTEKIDLVWNTRPRQGLGISATAITNPFVGLGGTLSSPRIGLKPAEAAISTGAAVITGGLSILAKGLFDRLMAEEDVCKAALAQLSADSRQAPATKQLPQTGVEGGSGRDSVPR